MVLGGLDAAQGELRRLRASHGISTDAVRDDPVLHEFQRLLAGKVGAPPDPAEEEQARAEAARRIEAKIPPGFKDKRKDDSHGDYLLWRQAIQEAKARCLPLLFVTRDVKEDWFWRVGGRTIGARPELVRECFQEAGVRFTILTTRSFLHHASTELKAAISPDTLRQAAALPPPEAMVESVSGHTRMALSPEILFQSALLADEHLADVRVRIGRLEAERKALKDAVLEGEADDDFDETLSRLVTQISRRSRDAVRIEKFVDWCTANVDDHSGQDIAVPRKYHWEVRSYARKAYEANERRASGASYELKPDSE